ncbi:MAG: peptidoglycan-binding protein [Gemmatimonadetes bacterium]|nr:peptidoglycan-binding protein [Gemmatimonadota bacterium]
MTWNVLRRALPVGVVALAISGCASRDTQVADLDQTYSEQQQKIEQLQAKVATEEAARKDAEEAARMAREEAARLASTGGTKTQMTGGSDLLPPNAEPGQCYARVLVPPVYETQTEQVMLKEAGSRIEVMQPKYDWAEQKVQTKEASYKLEVVPPTYEWVEENVMTKPARKELRVVPATYDTVTEKVLVTPERTYWKKGRGPIEKVDNGTGEIMCLVTEPARYETVSKRVVKSPERVEEVELPAEYSTVKRMVVKQEATTRRVEIPAEFKTVKVLQQVKAPEQVKHEIPAEYGSVTKKVMVKESYLEWRPVICETNMTGGFVSRLQTSLKNAGFDPGPIDGIYGSQTQAAVRAYQSKNGLATGGLTYRTVEKLGLKL